MNERYPDATAEEVVREDTCIICREEMRPYAPMIGANGAPGQAARNPVAERMRPKKLPCGHILHFACLRSWLERQQICPTCRRPVVPGPRQVDAVGQPAANADPAQPAGAGPGQPAAEQAHQGDGQPAEGQNRFRMLNLGPLRIGFGAGRGDLVNDLAHQINDHARPVQPGNQEHAQQYGFGFGFGRPRASPARSGPADIHTQLNTIEQRLQQEISELRMTANELHVMRMLEAELNRLRAQRQAAAGQPVPAPTAIAQAPPSTAAPPVIIRPAQALVTNPHQPILTAGSEALPEGLALPPGWTMMPLHRVDGMAHAAVPAMSNDANAPANSQTMPPQDRTQSSQASFPHLNTSHPPATTDIGLAGSSLVSNLNSGQLRLRDGSSNRPSSTEQTSLRSSTMTNGDGVVPVLSSGGVPATTSSAGPSNPTPTMNQHHENSTITLPSLPTWGSSVPLANPVTSRPSVPAENGEGSTDGENNGVGPATAKDVPARAPTENGVEFDTQEGTSAPSSSKGKSKAARVDDLIEDVD
jgi:E3 ubiquitin-protein ligase synoviolin